MVRKGVYTEHFFEGFDKYELTVLLETVLPMTPQPFNQPSVMAADVLRAFVNHQPSLRLWFIFPPGRT